MAVKILNATCRCGTEARGTWTRLMAKGWKKAWSPQGGHPAYYRCPVCVAANRAGKRERGHFNITQ